MICIGLLEFITCKSFDNRKRFDFFKQLILVIKIFCNLHKKE